MNSRPKYRAFWNALLWPVVRRNQVRFKYRCYETSLEASIRLSDIESDVQSIWELCVADTYAVDPGFAPDLVVDGGGNIGLFTLRMAAAAGSRANEKGVEFVIVEPLPRNIEQIRKHLDRNGLRAEIKPACLGGAKGVIPFYCREAIRSSFDPGEPYTGVIEMPVLRIQDAIGKSAAERILVKIDIEGMELEALRAFIPVEKRAVYVVGELHDYQGEASQLEGLFLDHGWTFEFYEVADNYAHFRGCSPAALPLLQSMGGVRSPSAKVA